MTRWEYKVVHIKGRSFWGGPPAADLVQEQLNRLGSEGWELVSSALVQVTLVAILKRSR